MNNKLKYDPDIIASSFFWWGDDLRKRNCFYSHIIYFLAKRVVPIILDRIIGAALEQTDVELYNKLNRER